jgi:hypothetical protein
VWSSHEAALVEQERRRLLDLLPFWFRVSSGSIEVEERSTTTRAREVNDSTPTLRLFVVATHRELHSAEPLARRRKVGCRVEIVALLPLDDSPTNGLGCVESFRWALEQAIGLLAREASRDLGLGEGWTVANTSSR